MTVSVAELYPSDDRVGQFALAMALAANDVEYSLRQAVAANPPGADDDHRERERFTFKIRIANGFLFEAIDALKAWQQEPGIVDLLRGLPSEAQTHLRTVRSLEQKIGPKVLANIRQNTFHFPHPDPKRNPDSTADLFEVTEECSDVLVEFDARPDAQLTFGFGDEVALVLALRRHQETEAETEKIVAGAIAFVQLVRHVQMSYCEARGFGWVAVDEEGDR
jgi:hypothetical protein